MALHKSYVYVLKITWRNGTRRLEETQKYLPPMSIRQQAQQHELHLLSPKQSRKILGVLAAPDGNSIDQTNILRSKAEKWSKALQMKSLYQHEALLSYRHALTPAIQYPLGASLLNESQCTHIQAGAMPTILQKCGIVSTIAKDIVHRPPPDMEA